MVKVEELIVEMKVDEFEMFCNELKKSKAEKHFTLAHYIRNNKLDESEIMMALDVNYNSYYTLRSRLYQRIREFLSDQFSLEKTDLYARVTQIPNLIYDCPRKSAVAILKKLETDLLKNDMPYELTLVYNALKKTHVNSVKYFHYSQLYNKHLAYTASLDKAEELLITFNKNLGDYYLSRDKQLIELLTFIKEEMNSLSKLYHSHHLTIYKLILDISYSIFLPSSKNNKQDDPIEDMLMAMDKILKSFPDDQNYRHFDKIYYFLAFEYYHSHGIHNKSSIFHDVLNETFPSLLLYNFCVLPSNFLLSKLGHYLALNKHKLLFDENKKFSETEIVDPEDVVNFINYQKFLAVSAIYSKKYLDAITHLTTLINNVSLKNYKHVEIEIKLLFTICYSMLNGYENAISNYKSALRFLNEMDAEEYANVKAFAKMLQLQLSPKGRPVNMEKKMIELRNKFLLINKGNSKMLEWMDLSDEFIIELGHHVKPIR